MQQMRYPWAGRNRWWVLAVLLVGLVMRLLNFPAPHEVLDVDELTYIENGLMVWEGMTPGAASGVAGPETWMGWIYIAGDTAWKFIHPPRDQPAVPMQVRPFVAVDRALFDTYADMGPYHRYMASLQLIIALAAMVAAFRLGWYYGGWTVAIAIAGVVACLPLYIDFAAMTRPYSDGWSFGLMSLSAAATLRGRRRIVCSGILFGLAVAARIDLAMIAIFLAWILWQERDGEPLWRVGMRWSGVAVLTAALVNPWMLQTLIGTLRVIATIRFSDQWANLSSSPRRDTLQDLFLNQGLVFLLLGALTGLAFLEPRRRISGILLAFLTGLLISTMFTGPYKPMRYHGAPVLGILLFGSVMLGQVARTRPRLMPAIAAVVVALPLVQGTRFAVTGYTNSQFKDDSVAWIETHVPPGTIVYVVEQSLHAQAPLPTAASADALWDEIVNGQGWRRKFERGLTRFHLDSSQIPRALSEQNLVAERALWRRWFILGGQLQLNRPRYDIRLAQASPTFGVQDLRKEFAKTGGVILSPDWDIQKDLVPIAQWPGPLGHGKLIYCSDDVKARLLNMP